MKNQKFEHHIAQVESDIEKFDKQETLKYFLETISEETK